MTEDMPIEEEIEEECCEDCVDCEMIEKLEKKIDELEESRYFFFEQYSQLIKEYRDLKFRFKQMQDEDE